jgi:hypothetical protein
VQPRVEPHDACIEIDIDRLCLTHVAEAIDEAPVDGDTPEVAGIRTVQVRPASARRSIEEMP